MIVAITVFKVNNREKLWDGFSEWKDYAENEWPRERLEALQSH